jgi:hypothetical protein
VTSARAKSIRNAAISAFAVAVGFLALEVATQSTIGPGFLPWPIVIGLFATVLIGVGTFGLRGLAVIWAALLAQWLYMTFGYGLLPSYQIRGASSLALIAVILPLRFTAWSVAALPMYLVTGTLLPTFTGRRALAVFAGAGVWLTLLWIAGYLASVPLDLLPYWQSSRLSCTLVLIGLGTPPVALAVWLVARTWYVRGSRVKQIAPAS